MKGLFICSDLVIAEEFLRCDRRIKYLAFSNICLGTGLLLATSLMYDMLVDINKLKKRVEELESKEE